MSLPHVLFITGTDTDVGKTVTTAALAARCAAAGESVAVYKPTQTGVAGETGGDMPEVRRLSGVRSVFDGIRLRDPMAPVPAARREGRQLPEREWHLLRISALAETHQHVLVEGAGGLLVELDEAGHTVADFASAAAKRWDTGTAVVCRSGLGTLNHTLLTLEALHHRGQPAPVLVMGSWPATASYIEQDNLEFLRRKAAHFAGCVPEGAAQLDPADFRDRAPGWLRWP